MEASGTSAAAMLVGMTEDVEGRPDAATLTLPREEIEEALASDAPLDLTLSVQSGEGEPKDVQVAWQRSDLEAVLGRVEAGPVTLSFDRGELYRALEHPDFEGHGMREIVLLVAAASSSAALMASTASGQVLDGGGGGSSGAVSAAVVPGHDEASTASALAASGVVVPGHDEAATASALAASTTAHDELGAQARGLGQTVPNNDEATLTARGIDPAIATAIGTGDATTARDLATPGVHDELGAQARGLGQTIPGQRRGDTDGPRHRPRDRHRDRNRRRHHGTRPRDGPCAGYAGLRVVVRGARRSTPERRRWSGGSPERACSSSVARSPSVGSESHQSDQGRAQRRVAPRRPSARARAPDENGPPGEAHASVRPGDGCATANRASRRRGARRRRAPSTRPCGCPCRSRRGRATCARASRAAARR